MHRYIFGVIWKFIEKQKNNRLNKYTIQDIFFKCSINSGSVQVMIFLFSFHGVAEDAEMM